MPFHRNFIYWIDKRKWKYIFLLATLELSRGKVDCFNEEQLALNDQLVANRS